MPKRMRALDLLRQRRVWAAPIVIGAVLIGLEGELLGSPEVTEKLAIHVESLPAARDRMDRGASYATLVVPPDFAARTLSLLGAGNPPGRPGLPGVRLLSNRRGSRRAGRARRPGPGRSRRLPPAPLPGALGLSAFYASLLILMSGFIGATIVNSWLDGTLGFAPTEIGSRWTMMRPTLMAGSARRRSRSTRSPSSPCSARPASSSAC